MQDNGNRFAFLQKTEASTSDGKKKRGPKPKPKNEVDEEAFEETLVNIMCKFQ